MGWLDVCMQAKNQFYCTIDEAMMSFSMVEKKLDQIRTEMDVCLFEKKCCQFECGSCLINTNIRHIDGDTADT